MDSAPTTSAAPSQPDQPGAEKAPPSIPDHQLTQRIGSGAYGEVWLARNLATGALRAVKIVYRSTFADDRPFNREFEGIKKFDAVSRTHPSQLALFHVGRNDSSAYFYYVMELADSIDVAKVGSAVLSGPLNSPGAAISNGPLRTASPTLSDQPLSEDPYIAHTLRADLEQGRLSPARALEIALVLTEVLAHLHTNGLIHRDIKPSNIIFINGRPKLADIGLVTDATDTRSIVGTEGYLAPEGPGSAAADIFALGKVFYEMVSGLDRRRFPELPEDLRAWPDRREVIELNEIVLKACAKNPALRYQSADAMLADLRLLDDGKSVQRRRSLQRGFNSTWKIAAVVAIAAFAYFAIKNERERRAMLARQSRPPWERSGTTNVAAWQAWERAFQMTDTYTAVGMSNGIVEFERAVALDPNYPGAWSTLSVTITLAVMEGYIPGPKALERAKFCAEKANALKPGASYPYDSLAHCNLALDYDFEKAERLFRKGVSLDPNNLILLGNFAWALLEHGQFAEAERYFTRIKQEEPRKASPYISLGFSKWIAGKREEGMALIDEGILLEPDRPRWRLLRGDILWSANQREAAARDWLRQVELGGFYFLDQSDGVILRATLEKDGPEAMVRQLISLLEAHRNTGQFVSSFDLARLHAHAGNRAKALDALEVAVDEHRPMLLSVKVNPAFSVLSGEPRFHAVLRRINLE